MIEAGLFLLMNAICVIFIIADIRFKEYFYTIPMFLFLVMGMWLLQGETVAFLTTVDDGVNPMINQTDYIIGNPDTNLGVYSIHTPWLGLGYTLGAIVMGFVVFLGLTDPETTRKKQKKGFK